MPLSALASRIEDVHRTLRTHGWKTVLRYAVAEAKQIVWNQLVLGSFSQHGEDLVIEKLLDRKRNGFYVDVGASDPIRMSNTKRFSSRGWHGINVEPNPLFHRQLERDRPRDINVNAGIAEQDGEMTFYEFSPPNLSTFSAEEASRRIALGFAPSKTYTVATIRLGTLLAQQAVSEVDVLCIDTEGYEMEVLRSNDWARYRPRIICIETATFEIDEAARASRKDIDELITSLGYRCVMNNGLNSIFEDLGVGTQ